MEVQTVAELQASIVELQASDTLFIQDGIYKDIQLVVHNSGEENKPIVIRAKNRGKVFFTGDVEVELRGTHIVLDGIYFKDGNRNPEEWTSHGPGLVAIYGSYNRITQCAFHAFDQANSAYITTSLTEEGKVPQYCRIDHCSFTEKITFDQVINLNNVAKKDIKKNTSGIPMYHRIDHCYFSNPKKPGNAGGGIRVGYWRTDYGRCLIDNNLFERQDSEPEIITSKSMENVYYNNTYKNCAGTMNFRHGDKQVAINNFFIGTDKLREYGGMFVWGSNHIIANNYFSLPTTLKSRGNAALFLNCGAVGVEHALAFNIKILNNCFDKNNGYAINFSALYERRIDYCAERGLKLESPRDLQISNNIFISDKNSGYTVFYKHDTKNRNILWEDNLVINAKPGFKIKQGVECKKMASVNSPDMLKSDAYTSAMSHQGLYNIEGIDIDISKVVSEGIKGKPLTWNEVGPEWLKEIPGTYAKTGKLSKELQQKFNEVKSKRK
ncbi:chloramphenicol resistance protein [Labilibacter sediminis]|nr:chloramphenicol resistance protein [Labilibacter sediminis]